MSSLACSKNALLVRRLATKLQTKRRNQMKLTTPVNAFPKRVLVLAVLTALAVASMAFRPASAQVQEEESHRLVGSWRVTVDVGEPQGFPPFPTLMTFHADGTMVQSRPYFIPNFGVIETTHHGVWKRISINQFAVTDFALAQGAPGNAALNGAFFGTDNVNFQPVLAGDGNSFTAPWTSIGLDPNGNLIVKASGTLSGVRIQVQL
jgi:hypothetical protein